MEELLRCLPIIIGVGSFVGFGVVIGVICRNEIENQYEQFDIVKSRQRRR